MGTQNWLVSKSMLLLKIVRHFKIVQSTEVSLRTCNFLECAPKSSSPNGCSLKMLIRALTAKQHENAQPLSTVLSINKISRIHAAFV